VSAIHLHGSRIGRITPFCHVSQILSVLRAEVDGTPVNMKNSPLGMKSTYFKKMDSVINKVFTCHTDAYCPTK
jgi:hypothetical protein